MKRLTGLTLLVLALAGCSGTPQGASTPPAQPAAPAAATQTSTPTPTWKSLPAGKFALTSQSGAVIAFTLPTPATDPAVAPIEAYRVKTGAAPVTYIVADVDNRTGKKLVNMYRVLAFDKEGHEYAFSTVTDSINSWGPTFGSDYKYKMPNGTVLDDATGNALYNQGVELNNANNSGADIGARKTMVLASKSTGLPSEFTRVAVMPSGAFGEEEATSAH